MPERVAGATDANRRFSRLLREVESGSRVTLTKDGKAVAVLAVVAHPDATDREAARQRMLGLLRKGLPIGFSADRNREEIHRR